MTYNILRGDLCYHLTPYFDFKDFINFCRTFKPRKNLQPLFYQAITSKPNFRDIFDSFGGQKLDNNLEKILYNCMAQSIDRYLIGIFGVHFAKCRSLMAADHIVLSGSTIVQVLLNEFWEGSDIDFFNPTLGLKTKGITEWGYCQFEDFTYATLEYQDAGWPDNCPPQYVFHAGKKIKRLYTYALNGKKIQIISIFAEADYEAVDQFIHEGFDLAVLMNSFYYEVDPETGVIVPKLRLHDIDSLMKKTTRRKVTMPQMIHEARVEKYKQRGFEIIE